VVNLSGNLFLRAGRPAFTDIDAALGELDAADHVLVDFHAEATSEKVALGWHLDGRVSAVVGTHTHVPTADCRVLPGGTAYITDVGMTGPRGGVIGVVKEQSIRGFVTHMNERYDTSDEDPWLMGVVIRCAEPMRAESIEQVLLPAA
jgi:calcineurin-like phosphoesterase